MENDLDLWRLIEFFTSRLASFKEVAEALPPGVLFTTETGETADAMAMLESGEAYLTVLWAEWNCLSYSLERA